ncbi:MAG: hypothetical protein OEL80_07815 [Desulfuromonadales bacterium]|nr:hypothetical protein [Desulfuromonadales bacterium]
MILERGEKIHVILRRNFEGDMRRHFIGEIIAVDNTLARVAGYAFVLDSTTGKYIRRPEKRIRIIGLADSGLVINVLPANADIDHALYTLSPESKLVVSDGKNFTLDINEFGASR